MKITDRNEVSTSLFFNELRKTPVLDKKVELELYDEYMCSNDEKRRKTIKDLIITSNIRWCVTLSKKYGHINIRQEDLTSIAYKSMVENFDKFDPNRNARFATFISFYIKNDISNYIYGEGKFISDVTSNKMVDKLLLEVTSYLENEYSATPTTQMIVDRFNENRPSNVQKMDNYSISKRMLSTSLMRSLSTVIKVGKNENDNMTLEDVLSDTTSNKLDDEDKNILLDLLKKYLDDREFKIVMYKFGMMDNIEYTNEMVGRIMNLTQERIGQIYNGAIKKLRDNKIDFMKIW